MEEENLRSNNMIPVKDFILLIPCYNNVAGLSRSINSIQYPIDKFEILIVDDGSAVPIVTDNFNNAIPGTTIQIIRISQNQGIVNALNSGLKELKTRNDYRYIARLDAGDTCHPERFTKQVEFLDLHSDVFLLGSWCRFENSITKKGYNYITKTKHEDIIIEMHYKCSFIHPTVMFRKEVLETIGVYPTNYPHAEDYVFFWKIIKKHKTAILDKQLVIINYKDSSISSKNYKTQLRTRKKIIKQFGSLALSKLAGVLLLWCKLLIPRAVLQRIKTNLQEGVFR
ncbi:MAG: glycosyltransferase [Bacteroidota bacterium]